ncbi:MAG: LysM peptidoglycan-binding domain-containing protein [Bacteroidetes bacterium]|nr:LysM peptidoglycan-binding domain-containing protein [Bacteroidota bacterium]
MRIYFSHFILLLAWEISSLCAQQSPVRITKEEYIERYKDIAVQEMNEFGIPASITIAQGVLESGHGNSPLATEANNHFGIKCHKEWTGNTYHMDDDEKNECFRKYASPEDSYKDHSLFLTSRERYFFLFDFEITDYKSWANGLKQAGYATNPKYPELLIKVIEDFSLYDLDKQYNQALAIHRPKSEKSSAVIGNTTEGEDFEAISVSSSNRKIYQTNGVKFILTRNDDTFEKIAADFQIYTFQVYKNNDLKKKDKIAEGQRIYIEPKKNKSSAAFHIVKPGETMHSISQQYAIKLKKLCKYNTLAKDAVLFPDQKLKLR